MERNWGVGVRLIPERERWDWDKEDQLRGTLVTAEVTEELHSF